MSIYMIECARGLIENLFRKSTELEKTSRTLETVDRLPEYDRKRVVDLSREIIDELKGLKDLYSTIHKKTEFKNDAPVLS